MALVCFAVETKPGCLLVDDGPLGVKSLYPYPLGMILGPALAPSQVVLQICWLVTYYV